MLRFFVIILATGSLARLSSSAPTQPTAVTDTGVYLGTLGETYDGLPYYKFEGVKYADSQRFKEATPVPSSSDVIPAVEPGLPCLQTVSGNVIGSEDCLFMNIYTPQMNGSLPVVVFIHGGGFVNGHAFTGPDFYMETKEVILVFIQYRLGVMGLIDFRSKDYPANLSLKDMVTALKWLKENIASFGGDPSSITIQGQSSGSVCVHLLLLSPLTKGLIQGGISESGVGCATWATTEPQVSRARLAQLAKLLSCPAPPSSPFEPADSTAECIQRVSPEILLKTIQLYQQNNPLDYTPFQPVLESADSPGAAMVRYPWEGPQEQVPWITGVNSDEGLGLIEAFGFPLIYLKKLFDAGMLDSALPYILQYDSTSLHSVNITQQVKEFYQMGKPLDDDNIAIFINEVLSGGMFNFPKYQCLPFHSGTPAWTYYFGYLRDYERNRPGVKHSEELDYLFVNSTYNIRKDGSPQDAEVSKTLVQLFVSFAKHQKPTADGVDWKEYDPSKDEVFLINNDGMRMATDPKGRGNNFWSKLPIRDKLAFSESSMTIVN